MKINDAGLNLIKSFEGVRLTVYSDIGGIPTVGYGHVTDMSVGDSITAEQAEEMLRQDLVKFEDGVDRLLEVDATENQFSALVCFAFNCGLGSLEKSHLLAKFNAGDVSGAAEQFERWDRVNGVVVNGLLRRRLAEKALFLS